MVPQFILEVHRPYRRKVREPDNPPGGPDGRVLRAVRRSPRKGSGVQGERGPADYPGPAGILPRVQPDLSGRVRSVLGIRGHVESSRSQTSLATITRGPRIPQAYGCSRLSRDSRRARHISALRLKLALANRASFKAEPNPSRFGGFPSRSQTTSGPSLGWILSRNRKYRETLLTSSKSEIETVPLGDVTTIESPSEVTSCCERSTSCSGENPCFESVVAIEKSRLRRARVRIIRLSSTKFPFASAP